MTIISIDHIIDHVRNRAYMSGVQRNQARVKATGEIFTPTDLVQEILDQLELTKPELFTDISKTFIDPTCGDGQFLGEVLIRKLERRLLANNQITLLDFEQALSAIYGVEYETDNARLCRDRLLCDYQQYQSIVDNNIVNADALRYHYRFDNSHPYDDEAKELAKAQLFSKFF